MPLYVESWFAPGFVRDLKPAERSVYLDLLLISWMDHGIDRERIEDPSKLARVCGVKRSEFVRIWGSIRARFDLQTDGKWRNKRLELVRSAVSTRSELQRNNARTKGRGSGLAEPAGAVSNSSSTCNDPPDRLDLFEPVGDPNGDRTRDPSDDVDESVLLLGELNFARMTHIEGARRLAPVEENLKHIRARLESGSTADDVRHVIAVCLAEVKSKPETEQWFNAVTPFRPENFQRKLAMTVRGASHRPNGQPTRPRPLTIDDIERREAEHRARMDRGGK